MAWPRTPEYGPPAVATDGRVAIVTVAVGGTGSTVPSFTGSVTVNEPVDVYACVGAGPLPVDPSPKLHAYVSASPSGSEDADPLNAMAWPRTPVYGPPA